MIFGFPNISAREHGIFQICVSTHHNYPLIMVDRDKKFEYLILSGYDIRKEKSFIIWIVF